MDAFWDIPAALTEGASPPDKPSTDKPKKRRRVFLWFFLFVQVVFAVWMIVGINAASSAPSCDGLYGPDYDACQEANDVGTVIGVGLIIGVWAAVDIILGIMYAIFRLFRR